MGRLEFKNKKDDIGKIEYTEENIPYQKEKKSIFQNIMKKLKKLKKVY